jgi:hypothetical protein
MFMTRIQRRSLIFSVSTTTESAACWMTGGIARVRLQRLLRQLEHVIVAKMIRHKRSGRLDLAQSARPVPAREEKP